VPEPVPDTVLEVIEFAPRAVMAGSPHLPGTREYFTCREGRIAITVAGERFELGPNDVLAFPGHAPHAYQNLEAKPSSGVSVVLLAQAGV
jgi:quercetin dioxygenase-like cupin family protein